MPLRPEFQIDKLGLKRPAQEIESETNLGRFQLKALFSSSKKLKKIQDSPSHRILRHIYKTLNIDKNKN